MSVKTILENRASRREFTSEKVELSEVIKIMELVKEYTPSSIGGWQVSFVITQNEQTLKEISELSGNELIGPQTHILNAKTFITVVVDFNRTNESSLLEGKTQVVHETVEGLLVGSVDAGLYTMVAQMLIEEAGYGTTIVGGIRNNPQKMIELLGLPKKTFPIVGFTIGQKNTTKVLHRPRMRTESVVFVEQYDQQLVKDELPNYNEVYEEYTKALTGSSAKYSEKIAKFYSNPYYTTVKSTLENQGFKLK